MPKILQREQAGLPRQPSGARQSPADITTLGIHWLDDRPQGVTTLEEATKVWAGVHRFHTRTRGWLDIGYNFGLCPVTGTILMGRGRYRIPAAHGSGNNTATWSLAVIIGEGDDFRPPLEDHLRNAIAWIATQAPNLDTVLGHRDFPDTTTFCPGPDLHRMVGGIDLETLKPKSEREEGQRMKVLYVPGDVDAEMIAWVESHIGAVPGFVTRDKDAALNAVDAGHEVLAVGTSLEGVKRIPGTDRLDTARNVLEAASDGWEVLGD